jgi:hypothetical protein
MSLTTPITSQESTQEAGRGSDNQREQQHGFVQADAAEPENLRRRQREQTLQHPAPDQQPAHAAQERNQEAFTEQLSDDAQAPRAQSQPDRQFFFPFSRAHQQQIGNIDAGN